MKRRAFTLVELLVVITIITILAALVLPAVSRGMRQALRNRALAEMQQLATVVTQVYSEIGYYVRLEDLVEPAAADVRRWANTGPGVTDYDFSGRSDADLLVGLDDPDNGNRAVLSFWSGPYTTYKNFTPGLISRPLDPWGDAGDADVVALQQYRMFWFAPDLSDPAVSDAAKRLVPAGSYGTMVIISPGPDGRYQSGIDSRADTALEADFAGFDPSDPGDDVYFAFNAGIQLEPSP